MKIQKKIPMWYKVTSLFREGLNKSQISRELNIDRNTVRRYLSMSEDDFFEWISSSKNLPKKLRKFESFVFTQLKSKPYLSSAQIEDKLKEHTQKIELDVCSKTVYNFVEYIRKKYNLPKQTDDYREYEHQQEVDFGSEAQVDFGESSLKKETGSRQKVYFLAISLSRSRQKFVYFQNKPFTSASSVYAHELAFQYFEGIPKKIIYDQDKVFMVEENMGDYKLTQEFKRFCDNNPFEVSFCRKADLESKGKIENIVRYVKNNFLRGRDYIDLALLNKEAVDWLNRTGNIKKHSSTKLVPMDQWKIEKEYLHPLKTDKVQAPKEEDKEIRNLRKDNSIIYKSNFYSVPTGTYKKSGDFVYIDIIGNDIRIYNKDNTLIATHLISAEKGKFICNTDHKRDKSKKQNEFETHIIELVDTGNKQKMKELLCLIKKSKPRYYTDHLRTFNKILPDTNQNTVRKILNICFENSIYNANEFMKLVLLESKKEEEAIEETISKVELNSQVKSKLDIEPNQSDINNYDNLF